MDLVEAVRRDHRRILGMADRVTSHLDSWPDRAGRKALDALVALESRHEAAEVRYLWPVVRDLLPAQRSLREEAQRQEKDARRFLHELRKTREPAAESVHRAVRQLVAHVGSEESQILEPLANSIGHSDSVRISLMYQDAMASGPTRPHPRTPAVPGVLALVAPLAARADRIRDLLRIR